MSFSLSHRGNLTRIRPLHISSHMLQVCYLNGLPLHVHLILWKHELSPASPPSTFSPPCCPQAPGLFSTILSSTSGRSSGCSCRVTMLSVSHALCWFPWPSLNRTVSSVLSSREELLGIVLPVPEVPGPVPLPRQAARCSFLASFQGLLVAAGRLSISWSSFILQIPPQTFGPQW